LKRGTWFDFEGTVVERNGMKSWWLQDLSPERIVLLLRTTSAHHVCDLAQRLRLLGLRRDEDPDINAIVAVPTRASEVFVATGDGDY
jgi:hypothetical protein